MIVLAHDTHVRDDIVSKKYLNYFVSSGVNFFFIYAIAVQSMSVLFMER